MKTKKTTVNTLQKLRGVASVLEDVSPQEDDPELRKAALKFAKGLRSIAGGEEEAGMRSACRNRGARDVVRRIVNEPGVDVEVRERLFDLVMSFDAACRKAGM